MTVPQVIVTLAPNGRLQAELPGANGSRRVVRLHGDAQASLVRMLEAQLRGEAEIGLDGAPTNAQVVHWEQHRSGPVSGCRFCSRARASARRSRGKAPQILSNYGGVQVRRVAKRGAVTEVRNPKQSAKEMGL